MIEPFDRDSVVKIKSEEDDFVIVGRETDGIELYDMVDFAKKWCNFFVLASKHSRVSNFDRRP